jgi:hypothetical protein
MDNLFYSLLGVAVAAIFCVYQHHLRDRIVRVRRLRKRVTLMLWAAANHAH